MNKYIELVKKWLDDPESVAQVLGNHFLVKKPILWLKEETKMNKHIELVKKWLDDPDSVTQKELLANSDAAYDANDTYVNLYAAYDANDIYAASYSASYAACNDAANAAYYADATDATDATSSAAYWVKRYEELSK